MKGSYIGNGRVRVQTPFGHLLLPSSDISMLPSLMLHGVHELPLTRYFLSRVKPGQRAVDVGAHVGYFTILLATLVGTGGCVTAYEPTHETYDVLRDNVSTNYVQAIVATHNEAVSAADGTVRLHVCRRFAGNTSVRRHNGNYTRDYRDEFVEREVTPVALGPALPTERVAWLKIDIEGGEH